jgi:hypothetical protein
MYSYYCRRNVGRPQERGDINSLGGETSHTSVGSLLFLFMLLLVVIGKGKGKGKAIPVQA